MYTLKCQLLLIKCDIACVICRDNLICANVYHHKFPQIICGILSRILCYLEMPGETDFEFKQCQLLLLKCDSNKMWHATAAHTLLEG